MARARFVTPLIVMAVLATFGRLLWADFTWWDDNGTIHHNPQLNPPTLAGLCFYWRHMAYGLYVPVTYTVWAALARVAYVGTPDAFGIALNPSVFHLANLLLHLASVLLAHAVLRRLLREPVSALLGTLLFALHPVQVETVAWLSGLKDLLGGYLSLACILFYLRAHDHRPGDPRSVWRGVSMPLASLALALAILSKPGAFVTPAILLVLGRVVLNQDWRPAVRRLLPMFLIAAGGAWVARVAQDVSFVPDVPLWQRPFVAGDALWFYLGKLLWPASLTIDYARSPTNALASPWAYLHGLVPLSIAVGLWLARRRAPPLPAAGAISLLCVAPVLGLTTFQMQAYSTVTDHYLYLAMLGPALAVGWLLREWPGALTRGLACACIVALAARSSLQARVWHDTFTLFGHAIDVSDRAFSPRTNLASMYMTIDPPRPDLAERLADEAYTLAPDNFYVLSTYGNVRFALGDRAGALRAWSRVTEMCRAAGPRGRAVHAQVAAGVAGLLLNAYDPEAALPWALEAVEANPADARAQGALDAARKGVRERDAAMRAATTAPARPAASRPTG